MHTAFQSHGGDASYPTPPTQIPTLGSVLAAFILWQVLGLAMNPTLQKVSVNNDLYFPKNLL